MTTLLAVGYWLFRFLVQMLPQPPPRVQSLFQPQWYRGRCPFCFCLCFCLLCLCFSRIQAYFSEGLFGMIYDDYESYGMGMVMGMGAMVSVRTRRYCFPK